jgi:hypothetical protein
MDTLDELVGDDLKRRERVRRAEAVAGRGGHERHGSAPGTNGKAKEGEQARAEAKNQGHGDAGNPDAAAFGRFFQFPWEFEEPRPPTLIKGLLSHGEEFLVYGPPEAGKSFFAVDLACC